MGISIVAMLFLAQSSLDAECDDRYASGAYSEGQAGLIETSGVLDV